MSRHKFMDRNWVLHKAAEAGLISTHVHYPSGIPIFNIKVKFDHWADPNDDFLTQEFKIFEPTPEKLVEFILFLANTNPYSCDTTELIIRILRAETDKRWFSEWFDPNNNQLMLDWEQPGTWDYYRNPFSLLDWLNFMWERRGLPGEPLAKELLEKYT